MSIRDWLWWHKDANCQTADVGLFYPKHGQEVEYKRIVKERFCDDCPVIALCLGWSLTHQEPGTWGGMTEPERNSMSPIKKARTLSQYQQKLSARRRELLVKQPSVYAAIARRAS
jgi:hypothetical protein